MTDERVYKMPFSNVYPFLVQKAERKGRTTEEVDTVIRWLDKLAELAQARDGSPAEK
jgi:hypothetical protein